MTQATALYLELLHDSVTSRGFGVYALPGL